MDRQRILTAGASISVNFGLNLPTNQPKSDDAKKPEISLVVRGEKATIVFAKAANGKMPAKEYLDGLAAGNAQDAKALASLLMLFSLYARQGSISNKQQFKQLKDTDPTVYEFKKGPHRIFCCKAPQGLLLLTHGFLKKKMKTPPEHIGRAQRIRQEHLGRTQEDT